MRFRVHGASSCEAASLLRRQLDADFTRYRAGNLILQGDRPGDVPVVALGPYMDLVPRANELRRDSNLVAIASNAALKHIVHAQFLANLLDTFRSMLVHHRRGACDDSEPLRAKRSKLSNDFFGEPVAEIVLPRIPGYIFKGKYGDHYMFRGLWNTAQKSPSDISKSAQGQNEEGKGDTFSGARRAIGRNLGYRHRQLWTRSRFDSRQYRLRSVTIR